MAISTPEYDSFLRFIDRADPSRVHECVPQYSGAPRRLVCPSTAELESCLVGAAQWGFAAGRRLDMKRMNLTLTSPKGGAETPAPLGQRPWHPELLPSAPRLLQKGLVRPLPVCDSPAWQPRCCCGCLLATWFRFEIIVSEIGCPNSALEFRKKVGQSLGRIWLLGHRASRSSYFTRLAWGLVRQACAWACGRAHTRVPRGCEFRVIGWV